MKSKNKKLSKTKIGLGSLALGSLVSGIGIGSVIYSKNKPIADYGTEKRELEYDSFISQIGSIFIHQIPLDIIKEKVISNGIINKQIKCGDKIKVVNTETELNMYVKGTCGLETAMTDIKIGITSMDHTGFCKYAEEIYKENLVLFTDSINNNKKIYIIGGSLGAAVTAYLVSFLLDLYDKLNKSKQIMGICVACPKAVNKIRNDKIYNYVYSVVNMLDTVTYIPPGSLVIPGRILSIKEENKDILFKLYYEYSEYLKKCKEYKKRTLTSSKVFPYHMASYYAKRIQLVS